MSLSEGTRLGAYEITGQIGAGGMGEVYRATDTRLGRDVAIKTLPAALASDKDRLARFEREAKLLAALNHPHIASVHSLDEHDGTLYLAMELVEGKTLEEKLKPGALPVEDALRLALQIAEALEVAHSQGVIHRDLKPANIMVTAEGQVKVLDFGLAKAFSEDPNESNLAQSPALSVAMTQQGLVLGTAGYMSPEQASGQPTDRRSDIWAFGVVLYEMLTGLPVFSGESVPHILAAVLQNEPDWGRLPKHLHPRLVQLVERCLRKKPRIRYQSIGDVRVDIEEILSSPSGLTMKPEQSAQSGTSFARLAAAVVIGGLVVTLGAWALWPEPEPAPVNRFTHILPANQTFRNTGRPVVAMSPDGRHFVYNTPSGLFLRTMGELEPRLIAGTEAPLTSPTFSPDGSELVYWDFGATELTRIGIRGGAPVAIADIPSNPYGLSWSADGTILIGQPDGIWRVSANGGTPELVIPAESGEAVYGPMLLPDGDSVLFSVAPPSNWDVGQIVVVSLSTLERTVLGQGGGDARFLPTGHLVFAVEDTLRAVRFDPEQMTVLGGAVPLVQGVMRGNSSTGAAHYGFSNAGTLVYLPGGVTVSNDTLVWVGRDGREEPFGLGRRNYGFVRVSPDGRRIAANINDGDGADIWVSDVDRPVMSRISSGRGAFLPLWTPAGDSIVTTSNSVMFSVLADGTGEVEELVTVEGSAFLSAESWSRNGEIVFSYGTVQDPRIGLLDAEPNADGRREWRPLIDRTSGASMLAVSPDGNWIAYQSSDTGEYAVYIEQFPDLGSRRTISDEAGGWGPVWSPAGDELYYRRLGDGAMMAVSIQTSPTLEIGRPELLFESQGYLPLSTPVAGGAAGRGWDVAPDGRFLMTKAFDTGTSSEIIIVQNWFEELQRRVPID